MHYHTHLKHFFKYFGAIFFVSIAGFLPALAHAQGVALVNASNSAMFTPSSSDQSIIYLGELFGSVPPILAGTGSSIMSQLFKIFNTAALALGIIIAGYTTFVGILNTAGEGEMLGKNWSSIWIPIRTVAGMALLVPTASGYCVCQIFMMWLLVQGIGAADTMTATVVDYMNSGQKIFVAGDTASSGELYGSNGQLAQGDSTQKYSDYDTMITNLYQGLSCMQAYQKEYPDVNSQFMSPPTPMLNSNGSVMTPLTYHFVANKAVKSTDPVTQIEVQTPVEVSCGYIYVKDTSSMDATTDATKLSLLAAGFSAIMPSLNSAAYFMVNDTSTDEDTVMSDTFNFVGSDFLSEVEKTYQSYVTQAENQLTNVNSDSADSADIRAYGWASLGSLYWDMANSYGSGVLTGYMGAWNTDTDPKYYIGSTINTDNYYTDTVWMYASGAPAPDGWATQFVNDLIKTRDAGDNNSNQLQKDFDSGTYVTTGVIAAISLDVLDSMLSKFEEDKNPMVLAQEIGHHITYSIEVAFTTLQVAMGLVAGAITTYASFAPGSFLTAPSGILLALITISVVGIIMSITFPGIFAFMAIMLTLGGTLAVVIPFIPVLAYSLAVIAWLIAALETIMAAPLVAIGLLHPDGQHPVWGKAEPAIMLIINMFIRPSLIVVGFVAAIILSTISIQFINLGFAGAVEQLLGTKSGSTVSGMETMLFITTYVGIILACVNKSFSVIEAIPNAIMRWIGHDTRFEAGGDAMQKIQGSQEGSAQRSGDSASQSAEASTHGPEKATQSGKGIAEARQAAKGKTDGDTPADAGGTKTV